MSALRRSAGTRPSSAPAAPSPTSRSGDQWTPDFSAGAAELQLETILNRFHLGYRATAVAAAALKMLARPEDVRLPVGAWAALGLEAADWLYLRRRTRTWQSMLEPGVISVDSIVGIAAVTLGAWSMDVGAQLDNTSWTNRVLTVRVAVVPFGDRRGLELIAASGVQVLPHLLWPAPGAGRRILARSAPGLASALAQGYFIGSRMRNKARIVDARALRWASEELAASLAAEEAAFHQRVLAPVPEVLRFVASNWDTDRESARRVAAAEERRLRAWLRAGTIDEPTTDPVGQMAEVERGVRRLSRRIEGVVRVSSALSDVVEIGRGVHRRPSVARTLQAVLLARAAAGVVLATEPASRRWGEPVVRRLVALADVSTIAAATVHERAEGPGGATTGWVERLLYEMAATVGAGRANGPELVAAHAAICALRAGSALASRRPLPQRLAAATHDALVVWTTGVQVQRAFASSLDQAQRLTMSTIDVAHHRPELHDAAVRHRAFVHDGVAQVLAAALAGHVDERDLREWLDRERVRVEAAIGVPAHGHAGDLAAALPVLREEFGRRGLYLLTETSELPAWMSTVGGTVVEIIREALNNVLKHRAGDSAWCGVLQQDDASVLIRITDYGVQFPVFRPGSGTGTATMLALAEHIGARVEWFQTTTGGTEVRMVVGVPTP